MRTSHSSPQTHTHNQHVHHLIISHPRFNCFISPPVHCGCHSSSETRLELGFKGHVAPPCRLAHGLLGVFQRGPQRLAVSNAPVSNLRRCEELDGSQKVRSPPTIWVTLEGLPVVGSPILDPSVVATGTIQPFGGGLLPESVG